MRAYQDVEVVKDKTKNLLKSGGFSYKDVHYTKETPLQNTKKDSMVYYAIIFTRLHQKQLWKNLLGNTHAECCCEHY